MHKRCKSMSTILWAVYMGLVLGLCFPRRGSEAEHRPVSEAGDEPPPWNWKHTENLIENLQGYMMKMNVTAIYKSFQLHERQRPFLQGMRQGRGPGPLPP